MKMRKKRACISRFRPCLTAALVAVVGFGVVSPVTSSAVRAATSSESLPLAMMPQMLVVLDC